MSCAELIGCARRLKVCIKKKTYPLSLRMDSVKSPSTKHTRSHGILFLRSAKLLYEAYGNSCTNFVLSVEYNKIPALKDINTVNESLKKIEVSGNIADFFVSTRRRSISKGSLFQKVGSVRILFRWRTQRLSSYSLLTAW